jgi:hypothetical protein
LITVSLLFTRRASAITMAARLRRFFIDISIFLSFFFEISFSSLRFSDFVLTGPLSLRFQLPQLFRFHPHAPRFSRRHACPPPLRYADADRADCLQFEITEPPLRFSEITGFHLDYLIFSSPAAFRQPRLAEPFSHFVPIQPDFFASRRFVRRFQPARLHASD